MPKRHREEEAKGTQVETSAESGRRFESYISGWVRETVEPQLVRPSSLPALTPLPSLVASAGPPPFEGAVATSATEATTSLLPPVVRLVGGGGAQHAASACGTAVVYDVAMLDHVSPDTSDYERPTRLSTTLDHLTAVGLLACCTRVPARTAKTKELRRVHSRELVDTIDQLDFFMGIRDAKSGAIGQDLFASEHTSRAARMAAGCVIEAAMAVVGGASTNAFALIRPPGHHAGPGNASGFCLYNNVAVAARAAQEEILRRRSATTGTARPRVLILDWDVHHCDGTESVFYDDPSVLVISIHQYGSGRGHVLRKTPTTELAPTPAPAVSAAASTSKDDIDVSDLAALLALPGDDGGTAVGVHPPTPTEPQAAEGAAEGRRVRRQVDYNKLAAELQGEGDDDIAALFGVDVNEAFSSSSASSSTSRASGGGASSSAAGSGHAKNKKVHYAGDTLGLSFDETPLPETTSEEPFYPGTGHLNRVGGETVEGAAGRNINIPWPTHDMGDLEYTQVMQEIVLPAAQEFQPELVFISAGFDSARGDLLGSMSLSPSGFYMMTRLMASRFPKLVVALEGGYNVKNVALGSEAVMRALLECGGYPCNELPRTRMLWHQTASLVAEVRSTHAPYWRCFADTTPRGEQDDS